MATVAHFTITDYDGETHQYYRFLDGYPSENAGVFMNFPQGDHDFCLETFERRLRLEKSGLDYIIDISYYMDLSARTIKVRSKVFDDIDFEGTFEGAIRRFAYNDYSEKDALKSYPDRHDIKHILSPGFLNGLWDIVKAIKSSIPYLEYDLFSHRILYIGDNINFYMYQDYIEFPSCRMNQNYKTWYDAYANARRLGMRLYFNNTITNNTFTLLYMLDVEHDGYFLPLTRKFIRYGEGIDDETKKLELAMLVKDISRRNPESLKARNYLYGLISKAEMEELKRSL